MIKMDRKECIKIPDLFIDSQFSVLADLQVKNKLDRIETCKYVK